MSGLCKDCTHWRESEDTYEMPAGWGWCEKAWLQPEAAQGGWQGAGTPKGTLAMAQDWSGYKAGLQTEAHFGCVQFEEKA